MLHSAFLTTHYCFHSSLLGALHFPHLLALFNLTGWNCLLCWLMLTVYFHRHVVLIVFRSSFYVLPHCMVMFTLLISRYCVLSSWLGTVRFPLYFWLLFLTTWIVYFYYYLFLFTFLTSWYYSISSLLLIDHYFLTLIVFFTTWYLVLFTFLNIWYCLLSSLLNTVHCLLCPLLGTVSFTHNIRHKYFALSS